ncbi:hypothetical protein [Roseateles flavus]|uniref:Uncharacterized protein n=1 Tax=Roseateles flavus TaxID=3149041 RepID=A0ABV0GKN7_9BURK
MHMQMQMSQASAAWARVRCLAEIEFLIKESEMLTGHAGRTFVISGADHLVYRMFWRPCGVEVQRLGSDGTAGTKRHLWPRDFEAHSLVDAMLVGQLYTPPVRAAR